MLQGADAQADARNVLRAGLETLIRKVRSKVPFTSQPNDFSYFTVSQASDSPGLCEAWQIMPSSNGPLGFELEKRFIVAGSFEPPETADDNYRAYNAWKQQRDKNCASRNADESWFYVRSQYAPEGPRLLDEIVTAARRGGILPFTVTCENPKGSPSDPVCADLRKSLAGIDPRDIGNINEGTTFVNDVMRHEVIINTRGATSFKIIRIVEERPNTTEPKVKSTIKSVGLSSGFMIIN